MEKAGTHNYQIQGSLKWKETLNDGHIMFSDVVPSIHEKDENELKKKEDSTASKYELSEANSIKNFKSLATEGVIQGKLYYYPDKNEIFKALEVKREDGSIISVKLIKEDGSGETELKKQEDIKTLRDYIYINLKIYNENVLSEVINTAVKLQTKIENELNAPLLGATGKTLTMFKLFKDSELIDKEKFLSSYKGIHDDLDIIATTGFSKPFVFKRFKKPYEWPYWGYYGTTTDAIAFIPNQNVVLSGFTLYSTDGDKFECKYKIYVDNNVVEEKDAFVCSDWEDKYYYRVTLQDLHEIKANQKLEITCQIAKQFSNNEYVSCYYGEGGDNWKDVENEHMGLWQVVYSDKSGSSSVGYGNFPEIMYYV